MMLGKMRFAHARELFFRASLPRNRAPFFPLFVKLELSVPVSYFDPVCFFPLFFGSFFFFFLLFLSSFFFFYQMKALCESPK